MHGLDNHAQVVAQHLAQSLIDLRGQGAAAQPLTELCLDHVNVVSTFERLLAEKLLAIRKHLGLSQTRMVMVLGADIAYHRISEYEIGRREPNLMVLLRYAQVAGVSVESLIDDNLDLPL